jgi:hypothetical protein
MSTSNRIIMPDYES